MNGLTPRNAVILVVLLVGTGLVALQEFENHHEQFVERAYTVSENTSLASLAMERPDVVERTGDRCLLRTPLIVGDDARLSVTADGCATVRMVQDAGIVVKGSARFLSVTVTSYNPETGGPIRNTRSNYQRKRPFIETNRGTPLVVAVNSTFSHLGYYRRAWTDIRKGFGNPESRWGFALYNQRGGRIINSSFHHNYFGFYTVNTSHLRIEDSTSHHNIEYGFDFHHWSDNVTIRDSTAYRNGNHGIVFSKWCERNSILNNHVYNNTGKAIFKGDVRDYGPHGIMLHHESDNNTIAGNILANNYNGIDLWRSSDNLIRNNTVLSDRNYGIEIGTESHRNRIVNNTVRETFADPIIVKDSARDNVCRGNIVPADSISSAAC